MTAHNPVEKNLKHKTDSMSWKDVPPQECDFNFRPPSWSQLSKSPSAVYGELLIVATVAVAGQCFIKLGMPWIASTSLSTVLVVAAVISVLVSSGWYRPLPYIFGQQTTTHLGFLIGAVMIAGFVAIRLGVLLRSFELGLMLLFAVSLPSCLYFADQLTGHMLHWWSADPLVGRDTMVVWRNAWQGRFITRHVDELLSVGVPKKHVARLKRYWLGHVVVICVYAMSMLVAIVVEQRFQAANANVLFAICATMLLGLTALTAGCLTIANRPSMSAVLGQWFLYLKDTLQPPWVMPSPAGNQLLRVFLSYLASGLFAISFLLFCGDAAMWQFPRFAVVLVAELLAPLHVLLICFCRCHASTTAD